MEIRVRFAPSPTGYLHLGGLRTALFNYLYAKNIGGKLVLRIEDTDQNRKVENSVEMLISSFNKLNINFDEGPIQGGNYGPYFQSKRLSIYNEHIKILLDNDNAYPCFCSAEKINKIRDMQSKSKKIIKYNRHCYHLDRLDAQKRMKNEKYVIRMKIPNDSQMHFYDILRGKVKIKCNELDDQILIKSDGFPTYHFANVVDDHLMGITHVMRGEEWLPSTPKHVLLYKYFKWIQPKFIHLPLLLNTDKSKLSKRQGDVAVEDYLSKGYLPEALINFVSLLGWHPNNDKEIYDITDLEKEFSLKRLNRSGAVFDNEKLNWMNSQYLNSLSINKIAEYARPFFEAADIDISNSDKFILIIENVRKRSNTILEMITNSNPFYKELDFHIDDLNFLQNEESQKVISFFCNNISTQSNWTANEINLLVYETSKATDVKGKQLYLPLRLALFGEKNGPDLANIIQILGVDDTLVRLKKHIYKIL